MMIGALLIDSTIVNQSNAGDLTDLVNTMWLFKNIGVKIGIVSTNKADVDTAKTLMPHNLIDIAISGEEVYGKGSKLARKFKGGPERISSPAKILGVDENRILYVGDDRFDYLSAINSGAFFLFATWTGKRIDETFTAQPVSRPDGIWGFSSHFLIHKPRWSYSIDIANQRSRFRSLMSANTYGANSIKFVCDPPHGSFTLREVLKEHKPIKVMGRRAVDILFWHAISSARLEGLLPPRCLVTIYASSTPNKVNPTINAFMSVGSKAFGTFFYNDMFIRANAVTATHVLRVQKSAVDIEHQTDSVHLNPKYKAKIQGQTIVVFDDFHTSGSSLEWARNLLLAAGAKEVILIAIGKFGPTNPFYQIRNPTLGMQIVPFSHKVYGKSAMSLTSSPLKVNTAVVPILQQSFKQLLIGKPY